MLADLCAVHVGDVVYLISAFFTRGGRAEYWRSSTAKGLGCGLGLVRGDAMVCGVFSLYWYALKVLHTR